MREGTDSMERVGWTLAEDGPDVRRGAAERGERGGRVEAGWRIGGGSGSGGARGRGTRSSSRPWGGRWSRWSRGDRGPDRGKAASRRAVVGIHVVLVGLAGLVVWVTVGGDPKGVATGASREAPAVPGVSGVPGDEGAVESVRLAGRVASSTSSFVAPAASGTSMQNRSASIEGDESGGSGGPGEADGSGKAGRGGGAATVVLASAVPQAVLTFGEAETISEAGGDAGEAAGAVATEAVPAAGGASPLRAESLPRTTPVLAATPPPGPAADAYSGCGQLYGLPGAERVVYLVDASGSLVDTFPFMLDELRRCITSLQPEQSYAIVFFRGAEVVEVPPLGMHKADTHALSRTVRWLDPQRKSLIPRGPARPDAALRRAFAYQPDAIVLVSDDLTGRVDPEGERLRLLQLITSVNLNHTVIHTAQLRHRDPLATPDRMGTLELIAFTTGGTHRYIREADLAPATDVTVPDAPPAIRF